MVAGLWRDWGSDMAQYFAETAYPVSVVTPGGDQRGRRLPGAHRSPAALRRLLTEGRDDVARALRCRQRDARQS